MVGIVWYDNVTICWLSIDVYLQLFSFSENRFVQEVDLALCFLFKGEF